MKNQRLIGLLRVMLKNSRRSDRELARFFGLSQPTISRMRTQLERGGYIKTYTVIPDFVKLGYEILAFTFSKLKSYPSVEEAEKIVKLAAEWMSKHPNVIFAAEGDGLGNDIVMVSFHRNYSMFADFIRSYVMDWGKILSGAESFIVSLGSGYKMKHLDLKYLADDVPEKKQ